MGSLLLGNFEIAGGWVFWFVARMHRHDAGHTHDACDRRNVPDEVETEVIVKRRVAGVARANRKKRVAAI